MGSIPALGTSPGEGNGNPLQYSCLGNPMDRGTWEAIVHGATKESDMTEHLSMYNEYSKITELFFPGVKLPFPLTLKIRFINALLSPQSKFFKRSVKSLVPNISQISNYYQII